MLNTLYIHKRYLTIREAIMTTEKKSRFTVITNEEIKTAKEPVIEHNTGYHSNPMYEKLLNFRINNSKLAYCTIYNRFRVYKT